MGLPLRESSSPTWALARSWGDNSDRQLGQGEPSDGNPPDAHLLAEVKATLRFGRR